MSSIHPPDHDIISSLRCHSDAWLAMHGFIMAKDPLSLSVVLDLTPPHMWRNPADLGSVQGLYPGKSIFEIIVRFKRWGCLPVLLARRPLFQLQRRYRVEKRMGEDYPVIVNRLPKSFAFTSVVRP